MVLFKPGPKHVAKKVRTSVLREVPDVAVSHTGGTLVFQIPIDNSSSSQLKIIEAESKIKQTVASHLQLNPQIRASYATEDRPPFAEDKRVITVIFSNFVKSKR